MKILFFSFILSILSLHSYAQSSYEKCLQIAAVAKKEHKDLKLKNAEVKKGNDDYCYVLISNKNGRKGVINSDNQLILPCIYENIDYIPKYKEGVSVYKMDANTAAFIKSAGFSADDERYWHQANDGSFLVTKSYFDNYCFYDTKGNLISDTGKRGLQREKNSYTPYYWEFNVSDIMNNTILYSLYAGNGQCLIDNYEMYMIDHENKFIYKKTIDGVEKYGMIDVKDATKNIPCIFAGIHVGEYMGSTFTEVCLNATDKYEIYDPTKNYILSYRDDGEKFFNQREFGKAIDFYKEHGFDSSWSMYFTALSIYESTFARVREQESFSEMIVNKPSVLNEWFMQKEFEFSKVYCDYDQARKDYKLAIDLLEKYLESNDPEFKVTANNQKSYFAYIINEMPKHEAIYKKAQEIIKNHKEQAKRLEAERRAKEKSQLWGLIIGAFVNSLNNTYGNSVNKSNSSGSGQGYLSTPVQDYSSPQVASSTSSSSTSRPKEIQYRQCHKCDGKGQYLLKSIQTSLSTPKSTCPTCGDFTSYRHVHTTCENCRGTGKVAINN